MRGIEGTWLLTGEADREPIRDGAVVLDAHERVLALGPSAELRAHFADAAWERHAAILTPGLVNAHLHLELSALRGEVKGGYGFVPWLTSFLDARQRLSPEQDREAIDDAVGELLRTGTVAIGEVTNSLASVDGLRGVPILARVFHEVFGLRRETAKVMLGMAKQRRAEIALPANVSYTLAPHTPYTLHPDALRELVMEGTRDDHVTSLHLAEHAAERAFLMTGGGPFAEFMAMRDTTPLDWTAPAVDSVRHADAHGALGPNVMAVHVADARADEIALIAERRMPVVLCPRSNLFISVKLPPLTELLNAGIRPALGTDSLASSPSLDVLADAAALHARFSGVAPRVLFAMATSFGARALRLDHQVGALRVGLTPGVLAFDLLAPVADPERHVVSDARRPRRVLARPSAQIEARP